MLLQKDVERSSSVGTKLPLWAFFLKGDFGRVLEKILVWCQLVLFSKKMWELSHFQSIAVWLNRYMLGEDRCCGSMACRRIIGPMVSQVRRSLASPTTRRPARSRSQPIHDACLTHRRQGGCRRGRALDRR
jgi:hypothetical protein